jgi:transcription elongation factor GreA
MANATYYVTKEGLEKIKKEQKKLLDFKRAKTIGHVPAIWHSEDVNPEYLAFQEDMSLLEARLAEYENILRNAELIKKPVKTKQKEIQVGATIICEVQGEKDEFTLVGSLEANPAMGKISTESPVGSALLGHKVGETIDVHSSVHVVYKILNISYS